MRLFPNYPANQQNQDYTKAPNINLESIFIKYLKDTKLQRKTNTQNDITRTQNIS